MKMSEPKRLHPIAAVSHFFRYLKELAFPFILFVVFGGRGGNGSLFYLIATVGIIVFLLISGILSWYRFTYRIEEGELRIEHGLFVRKKRYIPFGRIQSLNISAGVLQRMFQLVRVKVETAGSSGLEVAEAELSAISREEAARIQEILFTVKNKRAAEEQTDQINGPRSEVIYKISPRELLLLASTSGGAGVVISAAVAFFFQLEEIIPYERVFKGLETFISNGIIFVSIMVFVIFLFAWFIALVGTMLKYSAFTFKKTNHELVISRGLLEKRQTTIPLHRIQAVQISENLIRQPMGYASVFIKSAGGTVGDEESSKVVILPIIKKTEIPRLLSSHLPDFQLETALAPTPKRSLRRYLIRGTIFVLPVAILPAVLLRPWGYFSLLLLAAAGYWAYLNYRDAGWGIEKDQLTFRYRTISRNTVFMKRTKIQALQTKESYFQRRKQLATISATVKAGPAGSENTVIDLDRNDARQIYHWYMPGSTT